MNTLNRNGRWTGLLILVLMRLCSAPAVATDVAGVIATNTLWTKAGSPYLVTDSITVAAGAVLTLEAGVEVRIGHYEFFAIQGTLTAIGTEGAPIIFEGTSDTAGWWASIVLEGNGSATLEHCQIRNTGYWHNAGVYRQGGGDLILRNCLIEGSSGAGLLVAAGSGSVTSENNRFVGNVHGIRLLPNVSFKDNTSTFAGNKTSQVAADGGTHTAAVTWELSSDASILLTGDHVVAAGATLTLKPGLVVKSAHYEGLTIDGDLVAEGTSAKPIVLTSLLDDSAGGDTNNDQSSSTPATGWWHGIHIRNAGSARLDHCTVAYGGYWYYANIYKEGTGALSLRHSTLRHSSHAGLRVNAGYSELVSESNVFRDNAHGVRLGTNTSFSDTTSSFSNNASAQVATDGGTHTTDVTWELSSDYSILMTDDQTVGAGATLTLKPGLVVKSVQYGGLTVLGQLTAEGTANAPIHLTSHRDDSVGGDSNNDQSANLPSAGYWFGIHLKDAGTAVLDYCTIAYGGYWNYANLFKEGTGALVVRHSTLHHGSHAGLRVNAGSGGLVSESNVYRDNAHGVRLGLNTSFVDTTSTFTNNASAQVAVDGGTHTSDVHWELSSNYAILLTGDHTVAADATLTLKPGLVLKAVQYGSLTIDGRLIATGTADDPIHLTSHRDDSVGGDSNNNGTANTASPGWWSGLRLRNEGSAVLAHCTLAYGGYWHYANLYREGTGDLSLRFCTLRDSSAAGLRLNGDGGALLSEYNAFEGNNYGVQLQLNTSFADTTSTFAQNATAQVAAVGGTQTAAVTWELSSGNALLLLDSQTVAAGATLTLRPGLVVKFPHYEGLTIAGGLDARGTPEAPIHFVASRDDSVGGDTNGDGDATAPSSGWWGGLRLQDGGGAVLENVRISHAGYWNRAGVYLTGSGDLSMTDSVVASVDGNGLALVSATGQVGLARCRFAGNLTGVYVKGVAQGAVLTSCQIEGNTNYGVFNENSGDVDARGAWWGSASGPQHAGLNPDGTGDRVTDGVLFDPWRTSQAMARLIAPRRSGRLIAGDSLRFAGEPTDDPSVGQVWDFGDGRSSSAVVPGLLRFDTPGDFEVSFALVLNGVVDASPETRVYEVLEAGESHPDLRVEHLRLPADLAIGQSAEVTYTVANRGSGSLPSASWFDRLYLSDDAFLDTNDQLLGSVEVTVDLSRDESYEEVIPVTLPAIEEGARHLILSVNDEWSFAELHRLNNEQASEISVSVPRLVAGEELSIGYGAGSFQRYFRVDTDGGRSLVLSFLHQHPGLEALVRFGRLPSRSSWDHRVENGRLVIPAATAGSWYILVSGNSVSSEGEFTLGFELSNVVLSACSPAIQDTASILELDVEGAGFADPIRLDLVSSGGTAYEAGSLIIESFTRLTATFEAGRLPPDRYDVRVTQGTDSVTLDDAVEMVSGGAPEFHVDVITPSVMGYHQLATLFVEYENRGTAPMPAPLLLLTPRQNGSPGALMTLDRSLLSQGFWTSAIPKGFATSIRLLAGGRQPGVLMPGESMRIPVHYAGWLKPWDFSYPPFEFKVVSSTVEDDQIVPWNLLKDALKPDAGSEEAWDAVWLNLSAAVGNTVGDFVAMLSRNATYLSRIGSEVRDVTTLFSFELQKARGLIGPLSELTAEVDLSPHEGIVSLQFMRSFPRNLTQRHRLGPMGYGWNHGWEIQLTREADGTVVITRGNGATHVFQPDSRSGAYFSSKGDRSRLTASGGGHTLTLGNGTRLVFDASGRLIRNADRYGNAIELHYSSGLLSRLVHTNGLYLNLTYTTDGLVSRIADSLGHQVVYTYDGGKQLISVSDRWNRTTTYAYAASSNIRQGHAITKIVRPEGVTEAFTYDSQGRLSTHNDGIGTSTNTYDQGDVSVVDGAGHRVTASFNHRGRLTRIVGPESGVTTIEEDPEARSVRIRSADGTSMLQVYDRNGALRRMINQEGGEWGFEPGPFGQVLRTTSPTGRVSGREYGSLGELKRTIHPDGSIDVFETNSSGFRTRQTNALGISVETTYNAFGLAVKKTCSDGTSRTFEYDGKNRLVNAVNSEGATEFTYDSVGNLIRVAYPNGLHLDYEYDAAGRLVASIDPHGQASRLAYNAGGLLDRLMDEDGEVLIRYLYDGAGRLAEKQMTGGTKTLYERNGRGQITRQTTRDGQGAVLVEFLAEYDSSGLLTRYQTPEGVTDYTYDPAGRLKSMAHQPESGSAESREYHRNKDGLLEKLVVNGVEKAFTHDAAGRYTSFGDDVFTYDPSGNILSRTVGSESIGYVHDAIGNVVELQTDDGDYRMRYDALGIPLGLSGPGMAVNTLYDGLRKAILAGEYDEDGDPIRTYQNGLGMGVVHYDGKRYLPEYDPIGGETILALAVDASGLGSGDGHPMARDLPDSHQPYAPPYEFLGFHMPRPGDFGYGTAWTALDMAGPYVRWAVSPTGFGVQGGYTDTILSTMADSDSAEGGLVADIGFVSGLVGLFGGANTTLDGLARATNTVVTITDVPQPVLEGLEFLTGDALGDVLNGFGLVFSGLEVATGISETWRENRSVDMSDVLNPFGSLDGGTSKIRHGLATGALTLLGMAAAGTAAAPVVAAAGIVAFISDLTGSWQEAFWVWYDDLDVTGETLRGPAMAGSQDPNQKLGVAGFGQANHVSGDRLLIYRIDFENHPDATAPVQVVTVRDRLPAETDWTTFELVEIGFGDISVPIAPGTRFFETVIDYSYQDHAYDFAIEVHVDIRFEDGEISALFYSIDPETGLPPPVDVGFLPPEPDKGDADAVPGQGRGQGHLVYSVRPGPNLPDGTEIRNVATIQFDFSLEIDTNQVDPLDASKGIDPAKEALHTIDATAPTATVAALAPQSGRDFTVTWSGTDPGGSGVAWFDVYVSIDGGEWKPWMKRTGETSAVFEGESGHSYAFYAHATDGVGHSSLLAPQAQAQTIAGVSYLMNISNRGGVGTGPNVMIPGFVINGTGTKRVLIRAVGPRLEDFGLTGFLPDPQLIVFQGKTEIAANDDWADAPNAGDLVEAAVVVGAFDLKPEGKDAAALLDLEPSAYSVKVSGVGGVTGVALVEVYDADETDTATAKIINISNRGQVGIGSAIMIPGFVVGGDGAKTVLIRGVGPRLADFGVNGTLDDPTLTVFQGKDAIGTNDDWGDGVNSEEVAAAAVRVGAFDLAADSRDAAILLTLEPGTYTVKVSGVGGATGVALVEIYEVE